MDKADLKRKSRSLALIIIAMEVLLCGVASAETPEPNISMTVTPLTAIRYAPLKRDSWGNRGIEACHKDEFDSSLDGAEKAGYDIRAIGLIEGVIEQSGLIPRLPLAEAIRRKTAELGAHILVWSKVNNEPADYDRLEMSATVYRIMLDGILAEVHSPLPIHQDPNPTFPSFFCSEKPGTMTAAEQWAWHAKQYDLGKRLRQNAYFRQLQVVRADISKELYGDLQDPHVKLEELAPIHRKNLQYAWGFKQNTGLVEEAIRSVEPPETENEARNNFNWEAEIRDAELVGPVLAPREEKLQEEMPGEFAAYRELFQALFGQYPPQGKNLKEYVLQERARIEKEMDEWKRLFAPDEKKE